MALSVLQMRSFGSGATVEYVLYQSAMREFPAHESTAPFDTGMRELGNL